MRNLAFLALGALVLIRIAVGYADVGEYIGFRDTYTVRVELARTGGLFENAGVSYRGTRVGRVDSLALTDDGVEAKLRIEDSAPRIPADLRARVAGLSAVGEQYIDLLPRTDEGPYLADGSVVSRASTSTPAPVTDMITSLNALAGSVPLDSLRTTVDELGDAFHGQGQNLRVLLDTGRDFVKAADRVLPETEKLLVDADTVLRTQNQEARAIRDFATGARGLAAQLKDSDSDLRSVIERAPGAADQVSALLRETDPALSVLLANLTTTSELLVTRQRGTEELLVRLPRVIAAGSSALSPDGLRFGMVTTFFQPLPCTGGYGGTAYRNGLDTSPAPPLNTGARCTEPAAGGKNVRGSAHAPSAGVPEPARPGRPLGAAALRDGADVSDGPTGMSGLLGLEDR
nr:MlaD family protein [Streptomyces boncukensis]